MIRNLEQATTEFAKLRNNIISLREFYITSDAGVLNNEKDLIFLRAQLYFMRKFRFDTHACSVGNGEMQSSYALGNWASGFYLSFGFMRFFVAS